MTVTLTISELPWSVNAMYLNRAGARGKGNNADRRIPDDLIAAAYQQTGNIWRAAEMIGIAGQTVSKRLKKLGIKTNARPITDAERSAIATYYENTPWAEFNLSVLSGQIGRTRQLISRTAAEMGLTRRGRRHRPEVSAAAAKKLAEAIKANGHPRGALGMVHSSETRERLSRASKLMWATAKTFGIGPMSEENRQRLSNAMAGRKRSSNTYSRCKSGKRADLGGLFVRSSWEANYARYLNHLIRLGVVEWWHYEPKTFMFEAIKRGTRSYTPDFCVKYKNDDQLEYVEIKGWMDSASKTRMSRMRKYFPEIKIVIVRQKDYNTLKNKWASSIPEWE